MKDHSNRIPLVPEAMDACRPGSNDINDPACASLAAQVAADPELSRLYQRLQRFDSQVADTMHDVPVPEGLADRISDRITAAGAYETATPIAPSVDDSRPDGPTAVVSRRSAGVSRRWLMAGTGAIVAAAAVVAVVAIQLRQPVVAEPLMLEAAMAYFDGDWNDSHTGQLVVEASPPRDFPGSADVLDGRWVRWRSVSGFLGRSGVAYDLNRPGSPRATLYVLRYPKVALPSSPPITPPQPPTRNRSTAAWQAGPLLYVLVVEGNARTYRSYLDLPSGPLT